MSLSSRTLVALVALASSFASAAALAQQGSPGAAGAEVGGREQAPASEGTAPAATGPGTAGATPAPFIPGAAVPGTMPPSARTPGAAGAPGSNGGQTPAPPGESGAQGGEGARMRLIVLDAATFGIDPVVGRVATERMRQTGEEMGYEVLPQAEMVAAAQQLRMPYPPTPADLWRLSWVARAHRGAFARVWAQGGQYVIEIMVASLDGSGPFFARGRSGADDLRQVIDQLLRSALPPPTSWNAAGVERGTSGAQAQVEQPHEEEYIDELDEDAIEQPVVTPTTAPRTRGELRRFSLTLQTEAAFGVSRSFFYNHLVGLRFDVRATRDIALGLYVAYVNLNARNGRANNILAMLQFEYRIRVSPTIDLTIPLRFSGGYLPYNGPVFRASFGVNYALDQHWEIGCELAPMLWVVPNRPLWSMNVAVEATYRF